MGAGINTYQPDGQGPEEGDGLIAAYAFDGKGGGEALDWPAIEAGLMGERLAWIHLDYQSTRAQQWLFEGSDLDPLAAEALIAAETRPRSVVFGDSLLVTLRGVNLNPGSEPEDMVAIRVLLQPNRVVTTRRRRLVSVRDLRDAIERGDGPISPGGFLVALAQRLADRKGDVIETLHDRVDALEAQLDLPEARRGPHADEELRGELGELRREVIMLRRYLAPQREALNRLSVERGKWFDEADQLRLREVNDAMMRFVEELDAVRERAAVVGEELANKLADHLNQRMYLLSIITGLFLPLGFLTGLLGVNVGGIPGAEDPWAFLLVCALMLALVVLQLALFRWKRWL